MTLDLSLFQLAMFSFFTGLGTALSTNPADLDFEKCKKTFLGGALGGTSPVSGYCLTFKIVHSCAKF